MGETRRPVKRPVLLIDMDGTLIDTLRDLAASVNFTLRALGYPERSLDQVRSFVGNGAVAMLAQSMASAAPAELARAQEAFFAHYDEHLLDHSRLFAGWEKVFASGHTLVCATNKPIRFAEKIIRGLGLADRFALVVGGDSLAVKKPDAGVAEHIAGRLGARVDDFIIIGDGVPDGRLAQNCGFPFWAARWGYAPAGELDPYATLWLDSPADVVERLA